MKLFFENMKWLRGSSSSGKGVDEKVVVKVMTILMMVKMILIMMVILMIILMMVMMILYLPCHASKVMWNPLPDKVADLIESSISIILTIADIYISISMETFEHRKYIIRGDDGNN